MVRILEEMEYYAKEYHIPIMEKEGIEFLIQYIKEHQIHSILEIGTAIGYSAICMANIDPSIQITSIERDQERYEKAVQNVEISGLQNQITLLFGDAFDLVPAGTFDLIFIDAAKSQYIKFFEKFKPLLKSHGVIISDNLNFHGLTTNPDKISSKNLRAMVRKINLYTQFLKENKEFDTIFLEIGDGVGISSKK